MNDLTVQVGGILYSSLVNGEGVRMVIFMSGCDKGCAGCHNPEIQQFDYGKSMAISDIIDEVRDNMAIIDGVTLSGGDPFCQYNAMLTLLREIKNLGVNTWVYTGYYLRQIPDNQRTALKYIDVLVDGPFLETMKEGADKYTGSSNQSVIRLKEVGLDEEDVI